MTQQAENSIEAFETALKDAALKAELCQQDIHYIVQSIADIRQDLLKEHNFKISYCEVVSNDEKPINIVLWYEDSFQNKGGPAYKRESDRHGRSYVKLSNMIEKYFDKTIICEIITKKCLTNARKVW